MGKNQSKNQTDSETDLPPPPKLRANSSLLLGDIYAAEESEIEYSEGVKVKQRQSVLEREVKQRKTAVQEIFQQFSEESPLPQVSAYIPTVLNDAIFCGHLMTDLDSIAGAIGAAELYGGIPARASEINSETKFALEYWGVAVPLPIEQLAVTQPGAPICLVDHQQRSQVNPAIDPDRIVGVIDHHALQNSTIITERPIYIDIRPWGSMSTIIAHTFLVLKKRPRRSVAGLLLCAILSDTLNLLGPTTTMWDRMMVAVLCELCQVEDINELAKKQFKAKSKELASLTAAQLCEGDMKIFSFHSNSFRGSIGFAVIETTDDEIILSRKDELLEAMIQKKQDLSVDMFYLAVVNIVSLHSNLLLIGSMERSLALIAFPSLHSKDEEVNEERLLAGDFSLYYLGNRVSRKLDYIPTITRAINKEEWKP